ncbi:hypothetical protein [Serratia marcescens]|uniref:Phage tail protein n=1 Tax=Serratia marcescens TaxID=615 RepID=A0ABD5IQK0_SERMA|nr:hypothetical protein [Serratia marcescens]MDX7085922.1 hypothetical protein [Serratia marcescens]
MNGEPDKTINANTTFSTLEKAKAYVLGTRYVTQDDGEIVCVRDPSQDPIVEPLYSQEYVSALLAELDGMAQTLNVANDATRIWKERALAAEAKLATPVRLPSKNDDEFWFDGAFQVAKFDHAVERAISAAGFKFVGDKQ